MNERVIAVKAEMSRQGLDAYILETRENKFALTGFEHNVADFNTISLLVLTQGKDYFLAERMEQEAVTAGAKDCEVLTAEKDDRVGALMKRVSDLEGGFRKIGYEPYAFRKYYFDEIRTVLPNATFVPVEIVEQARIIKTKAEIEIIAAAMAIGSKALMHAVSKITCGISEKEIAWEAEAAARKLYGADGLSFPVIVASGTNSSKPHHVPTDKKLEKGDFVTIDFGVKYRGYCSDITRTYFIGTPTEKQIEIYETVLNAAETAKAMARIGMSGKELDSIAREIITAAGYGDNFPHSLGHGVGIEVHEAPRISQTGDQRLEENMVFTIEPGIYVPGFGGVRIEDSVVLGPDGIRTLTDVTRELTVL
jgi:Xaa-Pro aminopeptidase